MSEETIFHKIAKKQAPAYIIAEDDKHLAFLDIFPSHYAQTVVIPKTYATSRFSEVNRELMQSTIIFAQKVAKQMENKLEDILRVQVVIEGFEIDYFHIKLIPAFELPADAVHHSGDKASEEELQSLQTKLT